MKAIRNMAAAVLALAALPAAAGTIGEVRFNRTSDVIRGTNAPALIDVTIRVDTGSLVTGGSCEVIITPGDGTNVPRLMFAMNTATQTSHLRYTKPGTYKVTVAGFGSRGCNGRREQTITITQAGAAPAAAATAPAAASAMPACPSGWTASANAVSGAKLACVANPVALTCPQGTAYFSQRGVVGCR